ncbi:MAG: Holliday junction resolvase RuvX [Acidobacteria bacterium]|nr:Holliday junction resolvase RuvX [Acidobacteriota bacterium]
MRILALDVGEKTIGLALSDALGLTVRPFKTIRRRSFRADLAEIGTVIQEWQVGRIVLGYPLHVSGDINDAVLRVERLAEKIKKQFHLPLLAVDERYSTVEALELLAVRETARQKKPFDTDAVAAALILKRFLEEADSVVCKEW